VRRMPKRAGVAAALAVVAVIVSGAMGIRAETAPEELACQFVGVSTDESGLTYPTAIDAAAAFAAGESKVKPSLIESSRGVIDVTGRATVAGERIGGNVFAVRDHGRTVGFLHVSRDFGGWTVGTVELC
jgi:hypothetical protein